MLKISRLSLNALISFVFFILPSVACAQAQIHHWVDGKGIHHYSDTPPNNHSQKVRQKVSPVQSPSQNQVNYAKGTPTQVEIPLAALLDPKEKEDFLRRGINLEQKILVLFDDTY